MRAVLAFVVFMCSLSAIATELQLADGRMSLNLPLGIAHHFTDNLGRTVVVPKPGVAIQLRVGPLKQDPAQPVPSFDANAFVRGSAKQSGREVFTLPGTSSVAYIEYTKLDRREGYRVHERFGVVAFRTHYIMFTALVSEEFVPPAEVESHLNQNLWNLLSGVKER